MKNPFRRNKGLGEMEKAIGSGLLSADTARPITDQEWQEQQQQLGINVRMIVPYEALNVIRDIRSRLQQNGYSGADTLLAALEILLNPVMCTRRLDPDDVIIYTLHAKELIAEIKMNLPIELTESGLDTLIDAAEDLICSGISCSEKGWMPQLMKASPRQYEIRMGAAEKQKRE